MTIWKRNSLLPFLEVKGNGSGITTLDVFTHAGGLFLPFLAPGAMCIRPPSEPSMEEDVKVVGSLSGFAPLQVAPVGHFAGTFG